MVREVIPQTSLSGILPHRSCVVGAVFNRDESRILTWSKDKTARLWNTATGKPIGPALQHQYSVFGAEFNRDESRILTWSLDKTARLWDGPPASRSGLRSSMRILSRSGLQPGREPHPDLESRQHRAAVGYGHGQADRTSLSSIKILFGERTSTGTRAAS